MDLGKLLLIVVWLVVTFSLTKLLLPSLLDFLKHNGAAQKNWQSQVIPSSAGVVFPISLSLVMALGSILFGDQEVNLLLLLALYGTAFFGIIDDLLGSNKHKGLLGHLRYLVIEKKISTGVLKAGGISLLALILVLTPEKPVWAVLTDWLLLVLMVNFINLLDLRPGRALKVVLFFILVSVLVSSAPSLLIGASLGMSLAYLPYDLAGLAMLGDTGSNTLGMLTGLLFLSAPWAIKILLIVMLLSLHLLAEVYSYTRIITTNRWLGALDAWGRQPSRQEEGDRLLFVEKITKR